MRTVEDLSKNDPIVMKLNDAALWNGERRCILITGNKTIINVFLTICNDKRKQMVLCDLVVKDLWNIWVQLKSLTLAEAAKIIGKSPQITTLFDSLLLAKIENVYEYVTYFSIWHKIFYNLKLELIWYYYII